MKPLQVFWAVFGGVVFAGAVLGLFIRYGIPSPCAVYRVEAVRMVRKRLIAKAEGDVAKGVIALMPAASLEILAKGVMSTQKPTQLKCLKGIGRLIRGEIPGMEPESPSYRDIKVEDLDPLIRRSRVRRGRLDR